MRFRRLRCWCFPERVEANVDRMLDMVGGDVLRLRPHVKTHKMAEVVRLQVAKGITRFKCCHHCRGRNDCYFGRARRLAGSPAGRSQLIPIPSVAGVVSRKYLSRPRSIRKRSWKPLSERAGRQACSWTSIAVCIARGSNRGMGLWLCVDE